MVANEKKKREQLQASPDVDHKPMIKKQTRLKREEPEAESLVGIAAANQPSKEEEGAEFALTKSNAELHSVISKALDSMVTPNGDYRCFY